MDEKWVKIENYVDHRGWPTWFNGKYSVSNLGHVRHDTFNQVLREYPTYGGRIKVLTHGGSDHLPESWYEYQEPNIDFLVAKAFVPGYFEGAQPIHLDGDRSNNRADNLVWGIIRSKDQRSSNSRYTGKKVRIIETGDVFDSLSDCAYAIQGQVGGISNCLRGARRKYLGYSFEYVEEES